jgi:hypothetical protein
MVTIVERLAMEIRSGPVRAIFPPGKFKEHKEEWIKPEKMVRGRVIHSLAAPALEGRSARP